MFVNRIAELDLLEKRFASGQAEFIVLYGRRRVGKTELLAYFCDGKQVIFFVSDLGSEISLRTALSSAVNAVLFGPNQMNAIYATWEDLFQAIGQAAKTERLIVVLDEFPLMLILCGSYIGMMEETVLGYQAPLYGRCTAQYLLEPLQFRDARLFFTAYSPEDQVRAYAIYGGTTAYLHTLQARGSLAKNIQDGNLTRGSFV